MFQSFTVKCTAMSSSDCLLPALIHSSITQHLKEGPGRLLRVTNDSSLSFHSNVSHFHRRSAAASFGAAPSLTIVSRSANGS